MNAPRPKRQHGFTLIEISIVLVIIGLVVGGVLVGRDLISAAAVRAQVSQIEKYQTAVNTFRGKYGYLPGDIPNPVAGQFGFPSRGSFAGEGDGNGILEGINSDASGQNDSFCVFTGEEAMFWVDLSQAKLIDGSFTTATPRAVPGSVVMGSAINTYLPQAKIGSGGYVYVWSGGWQGFTGGGGDGLNYFAVTGVTGYWSANESSSAIPLLTVAQAFAIDKKVDDGLPQSGNVLAMDESMAWATNGPVSGTPPTEIFTGDYGLNPAVGPVTPSSGGAVWDSASSSQTCYSNGNNIQVQETYSITNNANYVNCVLSFKFQ